VADYRDRFPILAETTYLINHSLAAMPVAAEDRVVEYTRMWRTRGIRAWGEGWWDLPLTVGDQVGRIVGAPPGTICMHQNVTIAVAVILSCFRPAPARNRIVYLEGEFPSVRYLLQAQPVSEDDDGFVGQLELQRYAHGAGLSLQAHGHLAHELHQIHGAHIQPEPLAGDARDIQQRVQQPLQPLDLAHGGRQALLDGGLGQRVRGIAGGEVEGALEVEPQRGQRRLQLVGRHGEELVPGADGVQGAPLEPQEGLDVGQQFLLLHGSGPVGIRAVGQAADAVLALHGDGGQVSDEEILRLLVGAQAPAHLVAIDVGQVNIEQDKVRASGRDG